jgi:hypothetical protein
VSLVEVTLLIRTETNKYFDDNNNVVVADDVAIVDGNDE